jgi:hypothetical protein
MRRGWDLTKKAWGVVRANPGLVKLPIYGGIFAFIGFVVLGIPGLLLLGQNGAGTPQQVGGAILLIAGSYLSSFSVIYFNVALAASADAAFRGADASTSVGLAVARQRRGVIAAWAAIAALVSLFFNILRNQNGLLGPIAAALGAAIWSLITFLIVPVLAFEGLGPMEAIKRSASMFRDKWGQQITGDIAIGAITGLAILVSVLVCLAGFFVLLSGSTVAVAAGGGLLILGVVAIIAAAVIGGAVRGVFGVALYRYIAEEQLVGPFTSEELERSVKPSKRARPAAI